MSKLLTKPKILVLAGSTASGKSKTALKLASDLSENFTSVHIINADAMAIYQDMIIGTASPTDEEKREYSHHLFNFVPVSEKYSVHNYRHDLECTLNEIFDKSKKPLIILVGGSGQYISSFVENIQYADITVSEEARERLNKLYDDDKELFYQKLIEKDQALEKKLHINDKKRVVRAMEVMEASSFSLTYHHQQSHTLESPYSFFCVRAMEDREILKERIRLRIFKMFELSWMDEVRSLLDKYDFSSFSATSKKAIGYAEIVAFLNKELSETEMLERIYIKTCQLAKRQNTWFKAKSYMKPYHLTKDYPLILEAIKNFYTKDKNE